MTRNRFINRGLLAGLCFSLFTIAATAQEDLLKSLEEEMGDETEYAFATFKGTRAINLQSPQLPAKGVLQYIFIHRFGSFSNDYLYNNLGLNQAEVALQLDYGITDWLNAGLGMGSAYPRTYFGFVKYRLLRQSSGARVMPVSVVGYSSLTWNNEKYEIEAPFNESDRLSFVNELIIARKFSQRFSLEIVPTHVHYNVVSLKSESNDIFSIGTAARLKITQQVGLSLEYIHQLNPLETNLTRLGPADASSVMQENQNALSVGVDIETGGHVFQIFLTNSSGISDPYIITQTTGRWKDGDIHLGFNISRVFTLYRPKLPEVE